MAEKRKDKRGRVLRTGESQRSDGRYSYRYTDISGERRTVYSWKLLPSDKAPEDKPCESLRELEKDISVELDSGLRSFDSKHYTVDDAFHKFLDIRKDLKPNTRVCYINMYEKHVQNVIGNRSVADVRKSDISKLYSGLVADGVLSGASVEKLHCAVYQLFEICVEDKIIAENPSANAMKKLRKTVDMSSQKRYALTEKQQKRFVDFIAGDADYAAYADIFTVLLGTGLRIGELLGLRKCDCDFKHGVIFIDHALSYKPDETGHYSYRVDTPKTKAGTRTVPMFDDVRQVLLRRSKRVSLFSIDGYSGFLFTNSEGKPYTNSFLDGRIKAIVSDYNHFEEFNAKREGRDPEFLPKISAHIFRHTFCTRLCENTQDIKVIQEVMGHSSSRITMDTYNNTTEERKKNCFESLEGKIKLA